jgi:hypothetical protein
MYLVITFTCDDYKSKVLIMMNFPNKLSHREYTFTELDIFDIIDQILNKVFFGLRVSDLQCLIY